MARTKGNGMKIGKIVKDRKKSFVVQGHRVGSVGQPETQVFFSGLMSS